MCVCVCYLLVSPETVVAREEGGPDQQQERYDGAEQARCAEKIHAYGYVILEIPIWK